MGVGGVPDTMQRLFEHEKHCRHCKDVRTKLKHEKEDISRLDRFKILGPVTIAIVVPVLANRTRTCRLMNMCNEKYTLFVVLRGGNSVMW